MAQALISRWRIVLSYLVSGQSHKFVAYVNSTGALVGGVIQVINRDASVQDWTAAAQGLADTIANGIGNGGSWGTAQLEHFNTGLWQLQATMTPTGAMGGGTLVPASQITLVLRDTAFFHIRVTVLDTGAATPAHYVSEASMPASAAKNMVGGFTPTHAAVTDPYFWQWSRGGRYINSAAFVGYTTDLNDKVRRSRGLQ